MSKAEIILKCLLDNLDEGIHIVDNRGKTIYYNKAMGMVEGLIPSEVIGKRAIELLKGVEEDSSTLMNALKKGEKYIDVIQQYSSNIGKNITAINTTIPVIASEEVIAAIEISKDRTQLRELNEKICRLQGINNIKGRFYTFKDIIGSSEKIRTAITKAMKASLTNSSVLIYGETGCGKELFAQSIHYNGLRKDKAFIDINCAAIPSNLLESMLFGTVKGSFTGAENKRGLFEEAKGGTILLDEINSMDTTLQSKLLRVLQEGYIRPIGSNVLVDIDIRIIATLNEAPEKLIKEGKLRKDFYYRLGVIRIDIPPLRERPQDINELTAQFISFYNKLLGKNIAGIHEEVLDIFLKYSWPGNIRELKNTIEASMNMIDDGPYITREYVEQRLVRNFISNGNYTAGMEEFPIEQYLENLEKKIINEALNRYGNNISKTSAYLKISRQNLQYKIKKYNLL